MANAGNYQGQHTGPEVDQGLAASLAMCKAEGLIKSNGAGVVGPATPGTDYVAPTPGAPQDSVAVYNDQGNIVPGSRKLSDFAASPTVSVVLMLATGWVDGVYSFEAEYPHSAYDLSIEVAPTATAEQFEAFGSAMICGSADSNIATAIGGVPTVDIPIIIKVVAK